MEAWGAYHHVSQQHLKRYLAELDFRYNNRPAPELGADESGEAFERAFKKILPLRRPTKNKH